MKNIIFILSFLLFFSCSSIEKSENLTSFQISKVSSEIVKNQNEIMEYAKENNKEKIKEKMISTLKNDIVMYYLNEYDLSKVFIVFSEEIEVLSLNRAKSIMLLNFDLETAYFELQWEYVDNEWKIKSVESQ